MAKKTKKYETTNKNQQRNIVKKTSLLLGGVCPYATTALLIRCM